MEMGLKKKKRTHVIGSKKKEKCQTGLTWDFCDDVHVWHSFIIIIIISCGTKLTNKIAIFIFCATVIMKIPLRFDPSSCPKTNHDHDHQS